MPTNEMKFVYSCRAVDGTGLETFRDTAREVRDIAHERSMEEGKPHEVVMRHGIAYGVVVRDPVETVLDVIGPEPDEEACVESTRLGTEPLLGLKRIYVTQFLRPNGRQKSTFVDRPERVARLAAGLVEKGYRLEAEVLTTNEVHVDVSNDDEQLAMAVVPNAPLELDGSGSPAWHLQRVIEEAHDRLVRRAVCGDDGEW